MGKVVWKYGLDIADEQDIKAPFGAEPLAVKDQEGVLTLWMFCDPEGSKYPRRIRVIGTGNPMPDMAGFEYVGTAIMGPKASAPGLVWHVWIEVQHDA